MRLIIQIPCYNEEGMIAKTLADLPKNIDGIDDIVVMVVDDGSIDNTVSIAIENGVDYVVKHKKNRGLANTFSTGIDTALQLGADIIVNTDGDNQYRGECIADLVKPIIEQESEIVIGERPIEEIDDFSSTKKYLQRMGSYVVSKFAGIKIPDTTSGFRAYSRKAAMSLTVVSSFTYTLETIIQAGRRRIPMMSVPIKTNKKTRESRLFNSSAGYIARSIRDIILISTQVKPIRIFGFIGGTSVLIGVILGLRFLGLLYSSGGDFYGESGHVQSLILSAIFIIFGSTSFLVGLIADQVGANRIILEKIYEQNRINSYKNIVNSETDSNIIFTKTFIGDVLSESRKAQSAAT